MNSRTAILVDDVAADRQLAARALRNAGWAVHPARTTTDGTALLQQLQREQILNLVIITDLHMPTDPAHRSGDRMAAAGAQWALRLRALMEQGNVPRVPIVALTALREHEIHLTALAFGCDAVVPKPVTPDLAQRIEHALDRSRDNEPVGAAALLRLLRHHLADALVEPHAHAAITEQDLTKALLAYHRRGLVGLGESALAAMLAPQINSTLGRGERVYAVLVEQLAAVMRLGAHASLAILQGELIHDASPGEQSAALGVSLSEYYRRRREAIAVLRDLLTRSSMNNEQ